MGNDIACCTNRTEKSTESAASCSTFEDKPSGDIPTREVECLLECQNALSGSAVWCVRQQQLYWLDTSKQELWSFRPTDGTALQQSVDLGWQGSCLALRKQGGFVICSALGVGLLDSQSLQQGGPRLKPKIVCHPVESEGLDEDVVCLNDGRVDADGRLVVGAFHTKYRDFTDGQGQVLPESTPDQKDPRGSVYRISLIPGYLWGPRGHVEILAGLGKVSVANGLAFASAEGQKLMYFVDTPTGTVRCFNYGAALSGESTVTERMMHKGGPYGACIDSEGGYWVAEYGGGRVLRVFNQKVTMVVQVPSPLVTSCAFGGPSLDILYVTTARGSKEDPNVCGGLFACHDTGFKGVAANYFEG